MGVVVVMAQINTVIARTGRDALTTYGVRVDDVIQTGQFGPDWSVSHSEVQSFASGTLPVLRPFGLSDTRHTCALYQGWQGSQDLLMFGEVVQTAQGYWTPQDVFSVGGYLRRTNEALGEWIAFYNTAGDAVDLLDQIPDGYQVVPITTDADIIIFILEKYGIKPGNPDTPNINHSIEASPWAPATLVPIFWDADTPGWSIIQKLDSAVPWRTFDGRTGAVYRRQVYGTVPAGVRHTFVQGVDILDLQISKEYEPFNQVIVEGATNETTGEVVTGISPAGVPAPSPYIQTPPGVRTYSLRNDWIETQTDAELLADLWLAIVQEPTKEVTLTTFACADFDVGDGLGVVSDRFTSNAFVTGHTVQGGPVPTSTFTLRGSVIATPRQNQPPVPQFTVSLLRETMIVDGSAKEVTLITVDASASTDSDGTIATYSITIAGATYARPRATHVYVGLPPVTVTVTVTDDQGAVGTLSQSVSWTDATLVIEPIVLAEKTTVEGSTDGERTWQSYGIPVVAVAPIAITGFVLAGTADGTLYRSTDQLATEPVHVANFPAAITCIWINEQISRRSLVGLQDGSVWLSIDGGTTWTGQSTFGTPINDLSESPYAASQATVSTGDSVYTTFDLRTWTPLITRTGHTALRHAAGHDALYGGFEDGVIMRYSNDSDASTGDRDDAETSSEV